MHDGSTEGPAESGTAPDPTASAPAPASDGGSAKPKRRRRRRKKQPQSKDHESTSQSAENPSQQPAPEKADGPARDARKSVKNGGRKKGAVRKKSNSGSRGKKTAPSRKPGRKRGGGERSQVDTALRALAEMARGLLDAEGVPFVARPKAMKLELRVPLDPDADRSKSAAQVMSQLLTRVQEVREHESALNPGSVYCYFSESASADSSRPVDVRHVFEAYGSTGRPVFTDFVTMAVERQDPDVEKILDGKTDGVVAMVQMGRVLRTEQLAAFGKKSPVYRVLGQVDAGLYPLLQSGDRAAFSFQLLRGRTLDGEPCFRLHWVSAAEIHDVADPSLAQILKRFQQTLDRESLRFAGLLANGETPDDEEFVRPLLQDLAKRLRGRAKRGSRRTEHAVQRSDEGQRPTTKAFDDATKAADEAILRDDEAGTIVLLGPKNRLHVFTPEAKHVTSFVMNARTVQIRRSEGRWTASEPEDRGEFRLALRSRLESGDTEVEDPERSAG
ncbi:MAG: hypothetical protein AAF196_13860 [Planctomycetota bacterium]